MAAENKKNKPSLLGKLRTAVKKVTFLLNYSINQWRLASTIIRRRALSSRRFSFNERLGLTSIVSSPSDEDYSNWDSSSNYMTPSYNNNEIIISPDQQVQGGELHKTRSFPLQRTTSFLEEDDIDKRAEMFISNFYRQLKMERQVSLQLRYKKDTSFGTSNNVSP